MSHPDIVIFHGQDVQLVSELKEFLENLDFSVSILVKEGSDGKIQNEKVKEYIKNCKLALVLATFDPTRKNSYQPRPNVIVELTLCLEDKPKNTVVLREIKGKNQVELGSNLEGHFISISFQRERVDKLYMMILKELRSRGLLNKTEEKNISSFDIGEKLQSFLDQMDKIWDEEFDIACKHIPRYDWKTEKKFEDNLDSFFLKYWDVFTALIRHKKQGNELDQVIDVSLAEAIKLASNTWKEVADAKFEDLEDYKEELENEKKNRKTVELKAVNQCIEEIQKIINEASNRRLLDPWKKIDLYKKAIDLIDDCKKNN